jgi:hypothetical protein
VPDIPFALVPVRPRRTGWTAQKQRRFIQVLAECGIARHAAAAAGMNERSAHRLALREDAESFADAWDAALQIAARRGASLLFEYGLEGISETVWRDGKIVYQRRRPSEKALFFLLSRLDPVRFARPPGPDPLSPGYDPLKASVSAFDIILESLEDLPAIDVEEEEEEEAPPPGRPGGEAGDGSSRA